MFIFQPEAAVDAGTNYAIKVMGMDPVTFALLLSLIIIGIWWFIKYYFLPDKRRRKNIEKTKESVLLEIAPLGGGKLKRDLFPVYEGTAKEVKNKSGNTFLITNVAKLDDPDIEGYYLIPGHGWMDEYPYDVPENERVPVLKYFFHEGDPFPQMPLNPKDWDVKLKTNVTASWATLSREQSVAKALLGQFSGFFEGLIKALPHIQKIPLIFIFQIITMVALAVIGYLVFRDGQSLANISTFLLGK